MRTRMQSLAWKDPRIVAMLEPHISPHVVEGGRIPELCLGGLVTASCIFLPHSGTIDRDEPQDVGISPIVLVMSGFSS